MSGSDGESARRIGHVAPALDATDRAIIGALLEDGRISVKALADRAHISRASAYARLVRMREEGMITGYAVRLDPAKVGLGTSAYVSVTVQQNAWRTVASMLREIPYIEHFALVGGDYDALVLVRAPDNAALRHVVLERIQDIPGVQATRTWLVFEESPGRGVRWDGPERRPAD